MARTNLGRVLTSGALLTLLAACADGQNPFKGGGEATRGASPDLNSVRLVDRDVEAPEVFQVSDSGLWDGRPSLGGVWVAHPDVTDPERVIIRNETNGKFVIGALFRRERENPGPVLQISSDAAAALEMLAGAPATLNVTALRRQEVPIAEEVTGEGVTTGAGAGEIETASLEVEAGAAGTTETTGTTGTDATVATASAAIAAAEARTGEAAATPDRASPLAKPYIQLGLFSVEANAKRAGDELRAQGIIPVIKEATSQGKSYWRVLAGPASTPGERGTLLKKVKEMGYGDAYFVRS